MLIGSILIGALAGFALLNYVNGVEQDVREETQRVEVWVISADVQAGTTAADVQGTNRLEIRQVESQFRPANAISDLSQIQGRIAVNNLAANQILVQGMFDDPQAIETTFADLIEPDQIAFTITMSYDQALGGLIEPGDFIDLIHRGSYTPPVGEADAFEVSAEESPYSRPARFLYRGVRVIGVDDVYVGAAVEDDGIAPAEEEQGSIKLTFAVPADAAQKILSVEQSELVLALNPVGWSPEARPNDIPELIQLNEDLPGENGDEITPYGQFGWVDTLTEGAEAEGEEPGAGTSPAAEDTELDEQTEEG